MTVNFFVIEILKFVGVSRVEGEKGVLGRGIEVGGF